MNEKKETSANQKKNENNGDGKSKTPDKIPTIPIKIHGQYLKDISFENPNAPASITKLKSTPEISVNVNVGANKIEGMEKNSYEVTLMIKAEAKSEGKTAFICELTYAGAFTLGEIPETSIQPFLLIECPRILFPFARSILGNMVRDGGFPPLMIAPIDFHEMFRKNYPASEQKTGNA